MRRIIRHLTAAGLGLLLLFSTGCVGSPLPLAASFAEVEQDEVLVVGKVVLDPPLEGEQTLDTFTWDRGLIINPYADDHRNKVILLTGNQYRKISDPSMSDYRGRIEADIAKTFYVRVKNEPFYVLRSEIMMNLGSTGMEKALLPSGYRVDLHPGDRAVYIGTLKYHRDEFFGTKKIELIDEYKKENAEFQKRFGHDVKLRKALAVLKK